MSPVTGPGEAVTVAVKVTASPVTSPMPGTELDSVTVAGLLLPTVKAGAAVRAVATDARAAPMPATRDTDRPLTFFALGMPSF